ncbi:RGS domain-containing protein [Gorgonomyces haynaldii]|nr:RGS domain-containing protein [Gorgonomyces haynaldii]
MEFVILTVVEFLLFFGSLSFFIKHRSDACLYFRTFSLQWTAIFCRISGSALNSMLLAGYKTSFPMDLARDLFFSSAMVGFLGCVLRHFLLIQKARLQYSSLETFESDTKLLRSVSRFTATRTMWILWVLGTGIFSGWHIIAHQILAPDQYSLYRNVVWAVFFNTLTVLSVWYLVRAPEDPFFIRWQYLGATISQCIVLDSLTFVGINPVLIFTVFGVGPLVVLLIELGMPLLAVFRFKQSVQNLDHSIDAVLTDQHLFFQYSRFLAQEYALENLLFLKHVAIYKKTSPDKLLYQKSQIMKQFIFSDAPCEINIPESLKRELMHYFSCPEHDTRLFDRTADYVKKMLLMHSFDRFQRSIKASL